MNRETIILEVERADEALKSVGLLIEGECYRDAMSRLYYAVFHFTRALLATKDINPKSHQGALQQFSMHFVKTGIVELEIGRILARQQKFRSESDYNVEFRFDRESIEQEYEDAKKFREICMCLIFLNDIYKTIE
jgi:uncharacterized protein (UPF0332 family)